MPFDFLSEPNDNSIQSVRFYKHGLVVLHVALGLLAIGSVVYKALLIKRPDRVIQGLDKVDVAFEVVVLFISILWIVLLAVRLTIY